MVLPCLVAQAFVGHWLGRTLEVSAMQAVLSDGWCIKMEINQNGYHTVWWVILILILINMNQFKSFWTWTPFGKYKFNSMEHEHHSSPFREKWELTDPYTVNVNDNDWIDVGVFLFGPVEPSATKWLAYLPWGAMPTHTSNGAWRNVESGSTSWTTWNFSEFSHGKSHHEPHRFEKLQVHLQHVQSETQLVDLSLKFGSRCAAGHSLDVPQKFLDDMERNGQCADRCTCRTLGVVERIIDIIEDDIQIQKHPKAVFK